MGKFSFPYQICNSVLSLLTVLSHPPQPPRTGVWHCRKRLSMGSGLSLRPIAAATALHWGLVLT